MFHAVHHVTGGTLWANLHLLFWLSLVPFVTGWMNENHYAPITVAAYGGVLLCSALSYTILVRVLLRHHGPDSVFARAVGSDLKGNLSLVAYVAAIPLAFFAVWIALALYAGVALAWLVPDRRFERLLAQGPP
jgi:uncharacterized membrane protein